MELKIESFPARMPGPLYWCRSEQAGITCPVSK
jgi:hypothetical protein